MSGNPLSSGATLAQTALYTAIGASCVVPAGALLCSQLYELQGDPGLQYDAGMAWLDLAQTLQQAITDAERVNNSIGGVWRDDPAQEAYAEKGAKYIQQLMVAMAFAYAVGIGMIISAITMFIAIVIGLVMAGILAVFAALILAAIASVIGNAGASEALEADATTFALDAYNTMKTLMKAVETGDIAIAAGFGVFLAADVGIQFALGDHQAIDDMGQAAVDGVGQIASGMTAMLWQKGVSKLMRVPGVNNPLRTLGQAIGLTDTATGQSLLDPVEDWMAAHSHQSYGAPSTSG